MLKPLPSLESRCCNALLAREDQCEWHRRIINRMTGPECAVMCNEMNTYTIHTYLPVRLKTAVFAVSCNAGMSCVASCTLSSFELQSAASRCTRSSQVYSRVSICAAKYTPHSVQRTPEIIVTRTKTPYQYTCCLTLCQTTAVQSTSKQVVSRA